MHYFNQIEKNAEYFANYILNFMVLGPKLRIWHFWTSKKSCKIKFRKWKIPFLAKSKKNASAHPWGPSTCPILSLKLWPVGRTRSWTRTTRMGLHMKILTTVKKGYAPTVRERVQIYYFVPISSHICLKYCFLNFLHFQK